jgi:hypothetical protein
MKREFQHLCVLIVVAALCFWGVLAPVSALAQEGADGGTDAGPVETVSISDPPPAPGPDAVMPALPETLPPAIPLVDEGAPAEAVGAEDPEATANEPGKITITIEPAQTTYVDARFPNQQFSGAGELQVATIVSGTTYPIWSMVKFSNMSKIPPGSQIYRAHIDLYQTRVSGGNINVQPYTLQSAWSSAITYNAARGLAKSPYGGAVGMGTGRGWVSFDVSGLINSWWKNPGSNNGMLYYGSIGGFHYFSNARNDKEPSLRVELRCDFYAPTSSITAINSNHRVGDYVPAGFAVNWSGQDKPQNNCPATGVNKYYVQYSTDGGRNWGKLTDTSSTRYDFGKGVADGTRVAFRVHADDKATNLETCCKNQPSVIVDNRPPAISLGTLAPFSFYASFPVTWTAPDAVSGVESCKVWQQVNGGDWSQPAIVNPGAGSSFVYTVNGAEQGKTYGFRVQCRDRVGNETLKPDGAQVTTKVLLYPEAEADNITPNLISSQSPISNSFDVRWFGFSPSEIPITAYEIYYRYGGGEWKLWNSFPAQTTSSNFPFASMGMGDGLYEFQALAVDSGGRRTPLVSTKVEGSVVVALNGNGAMTQMPLVSRRP